MIQKKRLLSIIPLIFLCVMSFAQELSPETIVKRSKRKNLTVKEWNVEKKSGTRWVDHVKTYDAQGRCVVSIEYGKYGQKEKVVTKYDSKGFVSKEIVYNDKNKVTRVRKYEYNPDGTRSKQYNYLPSGRLYSVKTYEYTFGN